MICPRCSAEFAQGSAVCPECGVRLMRSVSGVMKTSAVMIASGDGHGFYRSVQEVPEPLRKQLLEITNGANSGTIVIADRAGKEQITHVMARRETSRERVGTVEAASAKQPKLKVLGVSWIVWTGGMLLVAAGGIIAAAFIIR
jgi:hypothetical protein